MNSSGIPSRTSTIFAASGEYNSIAETSTTTTLADGTVTMDVGYPPLTMTPISSGGIPPQGEDTNGIFNRIFTKLQWTDAGGGYPFSSSFASSVGGYPSGAEIPSSDGYAKWLNLTDANTTSPESSSGSSTGWVPLVGYGTTAITGLTSTSVTLTSLQASRPVITLAGTLTSNIYLYFPAWVKDWRVENNTTGGYSVLAKTLSGSNTVTMRAGSTYELHGNGTNIVTAIPSLISDAGGYILPDGHKVMYGVATVVTSTSNYNATNGVYESSGVYITPYFSDASGTISFSKILNVQLTVTDVSGVGQLESAWLGGKPNTTNFQILAGCRTANATMYVYWTAIGY